MLIFGCLRDFSATAELFDDAVVRNGLADHTWELRMQC